MDSVEGGETKDFSVFLALSTLMHSSSSLSLNFRFLFFAPFLPLLFGSIPLLFIQAEREEVKEQGLGLSVGI